MKNYLDRFNLTVTPIVAYGVIVLFVILGILGLQVYTQAEQDLRSQLKSRQNELATLQAIKDTEIWPSRLEQSLKLKSQAEEKIWKGKTGGVVAAQLQQTLRALAKTHDVENVVVRVDPEPSEVGEVEILRFEFTGRIDSGKDTIDLFTDLAASKRMIVITELSSTNSIRDQLPTYVALSGLIPIVIEVGKGGTQ